MVRIEIPYEFEEEFRKVAPPDIMGRAVKDYLRVNPNKIIKWMERRKWI